MRSDDLSERLIDFAVRVIRLCESLPNTYLGNHISKQLIRSCTSIGANYEEARGAESDADFLHKINITLKEARESFYWLKVIQRSNLIQTNLLSEIIMEDNEICSIFVSSVRTLKKKIK